MLPGVDPADRRRGGPVRVGQAEGVREAAGELVDLDRAVADNPRLDHACGDR